MTMTRLVAVSLAFLTLTTPMALAQMEDGLAGDPERGKVVYRSVGYCGNCHGWPGDGLTGTMLQAPAAPSLRESTLDTETLFEIIKCGLPGTPMPYHGRTAYRDDSCYGMALADFAPENKPRRGKTFSDADITNLVAYLETSVMGLGEPTFEECADFFDNPDARPCSRFK
ncbi:c-type cytochrome [Sinisalibacter aestuarii]|uniref:Cytochrome c domain-containing protein n=1 Tax=Sinisalibacter aestuarii TaxID=2949426 RepID=A0ABQ5LVI1_9RHOB|nr:cytochrome c [Sinisalibacter aestuarii]GKY88286.1 hypothetical protein STA1M1_21550 [Sinisalibacter aestuarii]